MTDREAMSQALSLAVLGEGETKPNPLVGCLVVKDGHVVGAGFHRAAGEAHAEAAALAAAAGRARGATLYVNLEPCAHHGRTPPCVEAIVAAGIRRVVAGTRDPNPLVNGRGVAALQAAGIAVDVGLMEEACRAVNAGFLSAHERARPAVTIKAAQSWDGQIAAKGGSSTWITSPAARRYAHRMRAQHDAVLVGAATVRRDDPRLTVRLPGVEAQRLRVVVTMSADLDPRSKIFLGCSPDTPRTRVYLPSGSTAPGAAALRGVADLVPVDASGEGLDLGAVLGDLAKEGIRSLLVEGGGRISAAFLNAGLVDDLALFIAPSLIGARQGTPLIDGEAAEAPDRAPRLRLRAIVPIGPDRLVLARVAPA
jgi:diaminohydroxyphosphoribosylaminopyrimidine deaminase/5-amino-6-(5-phosphoribosylamino)uracil reductase